MYIRIYVRDGTIIVQYGAYCMYHEGIHVCAPVYMYNVCTYCIMMHIRTEAAESCICLLVTGGCVILYIQCVTYIRLCRPPLQPSGVDSAAETAELSAQAKHVRAACRWWIAVVTRAVL